MTKIKSDATMSPGLLKYPGEYPGFNVIKLFYLSITLRAKSRAFVFGKYCQLSLIIVSKTFPTGVPYGTPLLE